MVDDSVMAHGSALLRAGGDILPIRIQIGRPMELSPADWGVQVSIHVGDRSYESQPRGADPLQALINGLVDAAVEVNALRSRGSVSYEGRRDDYFCLDELLRTPATQGYLPTGLDRPKGAEGPDAG